MASVGTKDRWATRESARIRAVHARRPEPLATLALGLFAGAAVSGFVGGTVTHDAGGVLTRRLEHRTWRVDERALTWQGRQDVRVETVPDPRIEQPTDAVVR